MAFGKAVSSVTKGADLSRPRLSLSWIVPAFIAVIVLAAVVYAALWLIDKAKAPIQGIVAKTPVGGTSVATGTAPGLDNSGWIS